MAINEPETDLFAVLHNEADGGEVTVYPEVHHVYEDDEFSPETDAAEQQPGDISVIIDLNEAGTEIVKAQSISPGWQLTNATLTPQNLAAGQQSLLLCCTGTQARQQVDIPDLAGTFEEQVAQGAQLIDELERRNAEIRSATNL